MYRVLYFNEAQYFSGDIPFLHAPCSLPFQPPQNCLRQFLSPVFLHRFNASHFNRSGNPRLKKWSIPVLQTWHPDGAGGFVRHLWFRDWNPWQPYLSSGIEIPGNNIGRAYGTLFVLRTNSLFSVRYALCAMPYALGLLLSFRPWRHQVYPPYSSFP